MPIGRDFKFTPQDVQEYEALRKKLNIMCEVINELQRKVGLSSELPADTDKTEEEGPALNPDGTPGPVSAGVGCLRPDRKRPGVHDETKWQPAPVMACDL